MVNAFFRLNALVLPYLSVIVSYLSTFFQQSETT